MSEAGVVIGRVEGRAVETLAREVMDDFRAMDPAEYAKWSESMRLRRETLRDPKGFSKERELLITCSIPLYVQLTIGRLLGDPSWDLDWKNMEAFRRGAPECFLNQTTGLRCAGE